MSTRVYALVSSDGPAVYACGARRFLLELLGGLWRWTAFELVTERAYWLHDYGQHEDRDTAIAAAQAALEAA